MTEYDDYDQIWPIMIEYDWIWLNMNEYDWIWLWLNITEYDWLWPNITEYDKYQDQDLKLESKFYIRISYHDKNQVLV